MHFSFRLPFPDQKSSTLGRIAIVLLYASIYWKDYASVWMSSAVASIVLAIGLTLGMLVWVVRRTAKKIPGERVGFIMLLFMVISWALTSMATGNINLSSYYIAIPCSVVIAMVDPRLFLRLMLLHFSLSFFVQIFEYFSGQYFFIYQGSDGVELDETLFGGSLDIFRAKGMFQGPLSAVAFGMWMAFLLRGNMFVAALLLISSFFASGRLGMLTAVVLLVFRQIQSNRDKTLKWSQSWQLLALIFSFVILMLTSDANRLFFISNAFEVENDQNVSRLLFWVTALNHYLSFGWIEIIFGNFGFIQKTEGATENDFLRLLLDCGLVGFLVYVSSIIAVLIRAIRNNDMEGIFVCILIVILMNIFPFVQSLSSAVLFWIYFQSVILQFGGAARESLYKPMN